MAMWPWRWGERMQKMLESMRRLRKNQKWKESRDQIIVLYPEEKGGGGWEEVRGGGDTERIDVLN